MFNKVVAVLAITHDSNSHSPVAEPAIQHSGNISSKSHTKDSNGCLSILTFIIPPLLYFSLGKINSVFEEMKSTKLP